MENEYEFILYPKDGGTTQRVKLEANNSHYAKQLAESQYGRDFRVQLYMSAPGGNRRTNKLSVVRDCWTDCSFV